MLILQKRFILGNWILLSCLLGCRHPDLTGPTQYLPLSYYRQLEDSDEYKSQLMNYNDAISADEMDAQAYFERAILYMGVGKYSAAEDDLTTAISLVDDEFNTAQLASMYVHRGLIHWGTKNIDQAIADYSQAIKLMPNHWEAYFHRWQAYKFKGETEKAKLDRDRGMTIKPSVFEIEYSFDHGII